MYVIIGLGNPGTKYEQTRHNLGFITLDYLAGELGIKIKKIKHKSLVGKGRVSGHKVLFVKPQTFMNLSGEAVREIIEYYKIPLENLIVIYDDVDIDAGVIRIRKKGGAGTHNGMKSVIYQLMSEDFPRVRIGTGIDTDMPLADYVTSGFNKEEVEIMENAVIRASKAALAIIDVGIDKAMNMYNGED